MRQEFWDNRLERARPLFEAGMSITGVAREMVISTPTASRYAKMLGIKPGDSRSSSADPVSGKKLLKRIGELRSLAEQGKTRREAASELGVCYQTIANFCSRHGILFKRSGTGSQDKERADAMMTMFRSGQTLEQIGKVFGVSRERVRQIIKRDGGIVGKDGGKSAKAARRKEARERARDGKYLANYGCTYAQYVELRNIAKGMKSQGKGYYRTPVGAFNSQRQNAISRGIEWSLSLWSWWQIWQQSGKWEQRGRGGDLYVMCRYGDVGAYEEGNVYVATLRHNSKVQLNNPYRSEHPDHSDVVARLKVRVDRTAISRKRKYFDLPIGVTFVKSRGRYKAQIGLGGKNHDLGEFQTPEEASAAYQAALPRIAA